MQRFSRLSVPEKQIAACSFLGAKKFQLLWQMFKTLRFSPGTPTLLLYCQFIILQMLGIKILDLPKHILNPRLVLCLELRNNVLTSFYFEMVVNDLVWFLFLLKKKKKN